MRRWKKKSGHKWSIGCCFSAVSCRWYMLSVKCVTFTACAVRVHRRASIDFRCIFFAKIHPFNISICIHLDALNQSNRVTNYSHPVDASSVEKVLPFILPCSATATLDAEDFHRVLDVIQPTILFFFFFCLKRNSILILTAQCAIPGYGNTQLVKLVKWQTNVTLSGTNGLLIYPFSNLNFHYYTFLRYAYITVYVYNSFTRANTRVVQQMRFFLKKKRNKRFFFQ